MLIFRRVVAILLAVLIAIPSLLAPVYRFPTPQPFAGPSLWNPYAHLSGTWQKANLHAHGLAWGGVTNGRQTDEQVVRAYKRRGYSVAGVSNYASIAAFKGVDTIPLYEHGYNIPKIHQLAIGARSVVWLDFPFWQSLDQKQFIVDRVGAAAELVSLNHPNTGYVDDDMRNLTGYQLMEIVNGPFPVEDLWDTALSTGHVVWALANDDAHDVENLRRTFIAWNMIDAPSASAADVIGALRQGRSYAVSLVGNNADAALKSVAVTDATMTIASTGVPATYLFVGQDGVVRGTANQVMEATYTFAATDMYIRTVIRTPNMVMYVNPVLRYNGVALPAPASTVDETSTWLHRAIILILSSVIVFVLWKRRRRCHLLMSDAHLMIREYDRAFNERRFDDAAEMFTFDAPIQHRPDGLLWKGPEGYLESARATIAVFPDLQIQILHVEQRGDTIIEIDLSATGRHEGDWDMGALGMLKADRAPKTVRHREMLEIRGGKITYSSITYDIKNFVTRPGSSREP